MDAGTNGLSQASYSIVAYLAKNLQDEKRNMILNNFSRSLQRENGYFKLAEKDSFYSHYIPYISTLLDRPDSIARFAVLSDDRDVIQGWSLIERDILHYVFVKGGARGMGIGRALVPAKINYFTHLTTKGINIWSSKAPHAMFDPFK